MSWRHGCGPHEIHEERISAWKQQLDWETKRHEIGRGQQQENLLEASKEKLLEHPHG